MKGKTLVMIISALVVIGSFFVFYVLTNLKSVEEEIKPTPEVFEFMNRSNGQVDFEHPYVKCIFEKTCNGTFSLGMKASLEENKTAIENFLNKYGKVIRISNFDYYSISFDTDNLYKIGPILNSSMFKDIVLYGVRSDYKIASDEELRSCEFDEDCVSVSDGCCGCNSGGGNTVINKNYLSNWSSYRSLACSGMACLAVMSNHWTCLGLKTEKCIRNACQFVNYTDVPCDVPFYQFCKNDIPKSEWQGNEIEEFYYSEPIACQEIVDLCEESKTLGEVLELCRDKLPLPENYSKGRIIAYFDSNSTEEEINNFVGKFELNIERKLSDYYYELRDIKNISSLNASEKDMLVQGFADYLNYYSGMVKNVPYTNPSLIIVYFYGNVSLKDSERLIDDYKKVEGFNSIRAINAQEMGIIKVLEGEEIDWICKLREENALYRVGFK